MNVNKEKIQKMFDEHFIDDCDEVFDASEEIIDFAIKVVKKCSIPHGSQQRELLIGLVKYINDYEDYLKGKEFEEVVKEYLSHINCG